jgi:large subunit ribosomal protein MRP49
MEIHLSLEEIADLPPVTEHQPVEFVGLAPAGARLVLTIDGQPLDPFLRPGEPAWRWRWNPGPAVGLHRVLLSAGWPDGGAAQQALELRVVTRKIDQERYELLLDDIQRAAYSVVYALAGAGAEGAALQREAPWRHSAAEEYYTLFEERLVVFERAVRRIAARPRERLSAGEEQAPLRQAAGLQPDALARLAQGQFDPAPAGVASELQAALRPGGGLLPRSVQAARSAPTTDIYEHQLLKHLLTLLLRRARFVGALAEQEAARLAASEEQAGMISTRRVRAGQIAAGCAGAAQRLRELRAQPFLAEVRPMAAFRGPTPLLQRDAAYREVYRMWQALRQHPYLAFDSPLFAIPIADLPHLYESWCAIQIARSLLALGGTLREQHLVERRAAFDEEDGLEFSVALAERVPLLVIEHGDRTLTLRYQPRYRPLTKDERRKTKSEDAPSSFVLRPSSGRLGSLDRHTRVPDLAIEVRYPGAAPRALLLDAKYRLDAEGRGVPQDALAEAYAYLGAIGYAGQRATLGALILYPGTGEPERYDSDVGVLPLLPGRLDRLEQALASWLEAPA